MSIDSFDSDENKMELLLRAHQKLKSVEEDNQILRMHLSLLEKDNIRLSQLCKKIQTEKQAKQEQNELLQVKVKDLEEALRTQKSKYMEYQIHKINEAIEREKQKSQMESRISSEKTVIEKEVNEENQKELVNKEQKIQRSLSLSLIKQNEKGKTSKSPLIKKNFYQANAFQEHKKFNYTQWRKNTSFLTLHNKNIVL